MFTEDLLQYRTFPKSFTEFIDFSHNYWLQDLFMLFNSRCKEFKYREWRHIKLLYSQSATISTCYFPKNHQQTHLSWSPFVAVTETQDVARKDQLLYFRELFKICVEFPSNVFSVMSLALLVMQRSLKVYKKVKIALIFRPNMFRRNNFSVGPVTFLCIHFGKCELFQWCPWIAWYQRFRNSHAFLASIYI